jgi:adenosylhomocysteine nucleosidase
MLLRQLVNNFVRQAAQHQLQDAVSQAAKVSMTSAAGAAKEVEPADVIIAFALGVESGGTVDLLRGPGTIRCPSFVEHTGLLGEQRVALIETGVGHELATRAVADVIALHRPRWIVSSGFAGALTAELRRGHILMADEVVDKAGACLSIGLHVDRATVDATRGLHVGRLATVDGIVRTKADKSRLADELGAVACDMETMVIAQICQSEQIQFLSVRIISDSFDDELPKGMERLLEQKTLAAKLGAATGAIFNRPSSIKDMWKLKEDAIKASDRLARFLVGVVEQLPTA